MSQGWAWGWLELQAGKGGDADVALMKMVEGAGREGSRGAEVRTGVWRSPEAVETLRIDTSALLHTCNCCEEAGQVQHTPS